MGKVFFYWFSFFVDGTLWERVFMNIGWAEKGIVLTKKT
jgi:hypothetical protein